MGRLQKAVTLVAMAMDIVSLRYTTAKTKKINDSKVVEFDKILAHLYNLLGVFFNKIDDMNAPRMPHPFNRIPSKEPYAAENFPNGAIS